MVFAHSCFSALVFRLIASVSTQMAFQARRCLERSVTYVTDERSAFYWINGIYLRNRFLMHSHVSFETRGRFTDLSTEDTNIFSWPWRENIIVNTFRVIMRLHVVYIASLRFEDTVTYITFPYNEIRWKVSGSTLTQTTFNFLIFSAR